MRVYTESPELGGSGSHLEYEEDTGEHVATLKIITTATTTKLW